MTDPLAAVRSALDDCVTAIEKLDALCCEPGRSPRMAALATAIVDAQAGTAKLDGTVGAAEATIGLLEEAGGQTGALQVGCCAPNRLPLYERVLTNLTTAQQRINDTVGRGH